MERNLGDILPILDVEHDSILSKQGDVTIGFEISLPEIFTMSNEDYEAFHQNWIKAIKILPKQSVFHKQDWFIDSTYKADFSRDETSFLSRSSERFFNERPFLSHHSYLFITKKPGDKKTIQFDQLQPASQIHCSGRNTESGIVAGISGWHRAI